MKPGLLLAAYLRGWGLTGCRESVIRAALAAERERVWAA